MRTLPAKMILLLILALFILPPIMAWMMLTGAISFESKKTQNLGQLVTPPLALDWSEAVFVTNAPLHAVEQSRPPPNAGAWQRDTFLGFWVILYPLPAPCSKICLDHVRDLRQVHIASGRNQNRVMVSLLLDRQPSEALNKILLDIYPQIHMLSLPSEAFSTALQHAGNNSDLHGAQTIYLVDPVGNIMMTYNGIDSPKNLNKDLKRLLTWSKLDKPS